MSEPMPQVERPSILVADFDSVEQARTWRTLGPAEATLRFIAMLRTSLMVGDSIYIDINQLFDGVLFLALGPDGIRKVLGLSEWNRLPFVLGVPPACASDDFQAVHYLLSRFLLTENDEFASSAFLALDPHQVVARGQIRTDHLHLLFRGIESPPPTDLGFEEFPLEQLERFSAEAISSARDAWIAELIAHKLRVCAWPAVRRTMDHALWESALEGLAGYPESQEHARRLCQKIEEYELEHSVPVRRSNVVTWVVQEFDLTSPSIDDAAQDELLERAAQARAALRWWSRLYYDAILEARGNVQLERIAFTDTIPRFIDFRQHAPVSPNDDRAEKQWGLRQRAPSQLRLFLQRLIPHRQAPDIRLDGESITALGMIEPQDFKKIWTSERAKLIRTRAHPRPRDIFDLTLLIRESSQESSAWSTRVRQSLIRFVVFLVAAVSLAFRDSGFIGGSSSAEVILWLIVAVAAAFPFDDFFELWKVGPMTMMASIRMVQSP